MEFFSRPSKRESGADPTDLAQVRADDALIESLRSAPLFPDLSTEADLGSLFGADRDVDTGTFDVDTGTTDGGLPVGVSPDSELAGMLRAWRQEIAAIPLPRDRKSVV